MKNNKIFKSILIMFMLYINMVINMMGNHHIFLTKNNKIT